MKKNIVLIVLSLALTGFFPLFSPAGIFAAEGDMILDYGDLLDSDQWESLNQEAQDYADTYGCGVYVLTVDSMDGMERRDFAENFYLENDLGVGPEDSGILFMVSVSEREYVTVTRGYGIQAFTDYGIEQIEDDVVYYLGDDEWYDAFSAFVSDCGSYLEFAAREGVPIDVDNDPEVEAAVNLIKVAIVVLLPLLIALIVCLVFYSQMKTARKATDADAYIPQDGFNLTYEQDQFLYRTETRRIIPKNDDNHSDSSGGSTVSSSGFGGSSGGKF